MKMKAVNLPTISASGGPFLGVGWAHLSPLSRQINTKLSPSSHDGSGVFQGDMKDC